MTELLTADQMRTLERSAMDGGAVTGLDLMERAGQGVVDAIFEEWPEMAAERGPAPAPPEFSRRDEVARSWRALVLCGPGNNGGDGFVVARMLQRLGWDVDVFLFGVPEKLPPDARENYLRWCDLGSVTAWDTDAIAASARPDLIVDAVFGIGLTRPLPHVVAQVLDVDFKTTWPQSDQIKTVAVDCPSGLDLDTGRIPQVFDAEGSSVDPWPKHINTAHLVVTFHTPKLGHYIAVGPMVCGKLHVADIGLRADAIERSLIGRPPDPERVRLVETQHFGAQGLNAVSPTRWPGAMISKHRGGGHKFDFGHVVVFSGGVGRGGAARLAARAALRSGAGLVTVLCPPAALQENACQLNAVMLRMVRDAAHLNEVIDDRVTAFCIGPGLGVSDRTADLVGMVLARRASERSGRDPVVVLDADALTSFQTNPDRLFSITHARTIVTPHEGEFARLFPDLAEALRQGASRVDVVRAAAARAGCIVLLKGEATIIAQPDGAASVHAACYDRTAPWLATAGAGDVLAGLIAGLAAPLSSPDLFCVAEAAVWLHVEAARDFGPGLIAEDLVETLPRVFRELGL